MRQQTIHFRSLVVDFNHRILLFAQNSVKYRPFQAAEALSLLQDVDANLDTVSAKHPRHGPAERRKMPQQRLSREGRGTKHATNQLKEHTRETFWARLSSAIAVSVWSDIATVEILGIIRNPSYRTSTHSQVTDSVHHSQDFL